MIEVDGQDRLKVARNRLHSALHRLNMKSTRLNPQPERLKSSSYRLNPIPDRPEPYHDPHLTKKPAPSPGTGSLLNKSIPKQINNMFGSFFSRVKYRISVGIVIVASF